MSAQESQSFHWRYSDIDGTNFRLRGRTLFSILLFLAIALLATLLFIYTRWLCRLRHPLPTASTAAATEALPPPPPQPLGLDAASIEGLPTTLHRASSAKPPHECCICLNFYADGDRVKVLPPCRHTYHCECVDKWLATQPSCPLCRTWLRPDSNPAAPTESAVLTSL